MFDDEWTPYGLQRFQPRRWHSTARFLWFYRWWFLLSAAMWLAGGYVVYLAARCF